jgi:transcriptional regulator with XRE-family HTH domain
MWTSVVAALMRSGLTQSQLAGLCGVAQSTISDLHRGASRSPSFGLGQKLLQLQAERCSVVSSPEETPNAA